MTASTDLDDTTKRVDQYLNGRSADDLIDWNGGGLGPELLASDLRLLLAALDQVTTQRDEIQANRDALAHKVAEQRAVIARVREFADHLESLGTTSVYESATEIGQMIRAALDGDDTTPTEPAECDHPGIEHGPFWATGICPKCRRCKFIGHGPLCVDCLTDATTTDGDAVHEGDTHA